MCVCICLVEKMIIYCVPSGKLKYQRKSTIPMGKLIIHGNFQFSYVQLPEGMSSFPTSLWGEFPAMLVPPNPLS